MVFECKRIHVSPVLTLNDMTVIAEIKRMDPSEVRIYLDGKEVLNHIKGFIFSIAFRQITGYDLPRFQEFKDFNREEDCMLYIDVPYPKENQDNRGYDAMEIYLVKYW